MIYIYSTMLHGSRERLYLQMPARDRWSPGNAVSTSRNPCRLAIREGKRNTAETSRAELARTLRRWRRQGNRHQITQADAGRFARA